LDEHRSVGSLDDQRVGKELGPVFVDLSEHLDISSVSGELLLFDPPFPECLHLLFNGLDVGFVPVVVEA